MPMMFDLIKKPANGDAVIRIYQYECRLNSRAVKLLGLKEGFTKVRFTYDREEQTYGRGMRVYVSSCEDSSPRGYTITRNRQCARIYSTSLCDALADALDGRGTYRICPDVTKHENGVTYYEIFFRKYE